MPSAPAEPSGSRSASPPIYDIGDRREMLVDLENDPGEMTNLAEDPTCRDTLLDCRKRLRQWYRAHGETLAPGYVVA